MIWVVSVKDCGGVYCLIVERDDLPVPTVIRIYLDQCPRKRITTNTIKKLIYEGYERTSPSPVDNCEVMLKLGYKLKVCLWTGWCL